MKNKTQELKKEIEVLNEEDTVFVEYNHAFYFIKIMDINREYLVNVKTVEKLDFENDGVSIYTNRGEKIQISRRQYVVFKSLKTL